ncbi:YhcN/YlaJ family sporulation lipoprotein [Paenibacillus solani]|uniref:YhcN/YlaJ family sporulation lipoprotein n=1 Tax=Paenibacillus solani TaxID=1705565 RepID=UPI003D2A461D
MRAALSIMLVMILLAGCGNANQNASPSPRNQTNGAKANNVPGMNGDRGYTTNNVGNTDLDNTNTGLVNNRNANDGQVDATTADHLKALAERVPGVNNANCVVMGKTAVVGLNVDGNLDRAEVGTIKYTVAEALKTDPAGANALVTADMDVSNRIADLGRHIQEGHPISGLASELADIVGRIIPQLPRDVTPRNGNVQPMNNGAGTRQPNNQGNGAANPSHNR